MLVFSLFQQRTTTHTMDERKCSPSTGESWLDNYDPDYFYHLTDVHVSHYNPSTWENFQKSLSIGASMKAHTVLITGDLVDNYYLPFYPSRIQETEQRLDDWTRYYQIVNSFRNKYNLFLETFGNHDIPRVYSKDSDNFYYSQYTMISHTHNNFSTPENPYDIFTEKIGNFTFLALNPMFFPLPPLPFNYYVHAPTEYIEKVEKVVDSIPDNENVILATHYHGPTWSEIYTPFEESVSTNRFFDTILQTPKIKMLITGHNHGANRMIMHYNDSVEICASDLRYNLKSGIVTNDNNNIVYHWFGIDNPTQSFVTYPVPVEQTTSRTECSVQKVRAISFSNQTNLKVNIDSNPRLLTPIRTLPNNQDATLYEADLSDLQPGKHHLQLIGEEEEEFDFLVGPSQVIESTTELLYDDMFWAHFQWIGLLILVPMFLFVSFPCSFCRACSFRGYWAWINKCDNYEDSDEIPNDSSICSTSSIQCNLSDDTNLIFDIKYWIYSIFFGFVGIRSRIMKLPFLLRLVLFISVLGSLFVPVFIFNVDGHFGYMFIFGFLMGSSEHSHTDVDHYSARIYGGWDLRYEEWCPFLGFFYFGVAIVPVILAASSLGLMPKKEKESWFQLIDFLVELGGLIGGFLICFNSFLLLCRRECAMLSPFILFPLTWLLILTIFFVLRSHGKRSTPSQSSLLQVLKDEHDDSLVTND